MRVLWFTNCPPPAVDLRNGRLPAHEPWISEMLAAVAATKRVTLAVATASPGDHDDHFEYEGVEYFVVGQPPMSFYKVTKNCVERCLAVVNGWRPDLIHVHGSERFYGLLSARGLLRVPVLISIQGLIGECTKHFFGGLSAREVLRCQRAIEFGLRRGLFWAYRNYRAAAGQEREILTRAKAFAGRTDWDLAHVKSLNPEAAYYHVGEILRAPFYHRCWDIATCCEHTVFCTNGTDRYPRRGMHVLIRALKMVRTQFPDAVLRVGGIFASRRGYGRFLLRVVRELGLQQAVQFVGYLDAGALIEELCRANVFVTASMAENSPNSLCEAMAVGMPCVAAYTGGVPSLIGHGVNGLFHPTGDAAVLAERICRLFSDHSLAMRLGAAARKDALIRHSHDRVVTQLLAAYDDVLIGCGSPNGKHHVPVSLREVTR